MREAIKKHNNLGWNWARAAEYAQDRFDTIESAEQISAAAQDHEDYYLEMVAQNKPDHKLL